ncbi:hypothetical protein ACO0LM_26375 [Undibacterium sp. Di26W]|uniref:hypothetical protein n=1 Tax=Undibacterium sp. Di26W TaxID=3413035 RepID=UPI003BEF9D49
MIKKVYWLLRREYWENKTMLVWVNAILALLVILVFAFSNLGNFRAYGKVVIPADMDSAEFRYMLTILTETFSLSATCFSFVLPLLIGAYCLSSLYNDRHDKSILFWQSMPISATSTVVSKLIFALLVLPLASFLYALLASVFLVIILVVKLKFGGLHADIFTALLTDPRTYLLPLKTLALLPIYVLWALPGVGWLMLTSSWARVKPALWAIGIPVVTVMLPTIMKNSLGMDLNVRWLQFNLLGRSLLSIIPASWFAYEKVSDEKVNFIHSFAGWPNDMISGSWELLYKSELWYGVVLGAGMICMAIYLRQRRAMS